MKNDFSDLMDITSMKDIRNYHRYDPDISHVMEVRDLEIGIVAGWLINGNVEELKSSIDNNQVLLEPDIPDICTVECIRIEPYYLVKNRKIIFR